MRGLLAAWVLAAATCLGSSVAMALETGLAVQVLDASASSPSVDAVVSGSLDGQFKPFDLREVRRRVDGAFWLKLRSIEGYSAAAIQSISVHKGRNLNVALFTHRENESVLLHQAASLAEPALAQEFVFVLPDDAPTVGQSIYAYVEVRGAGTHPLSFSIAPLEQTLKENAAQERVIAISFGALIVMALASLMIWFVMTDKLFLLYSLLVSMQAMYVIYLSGYGFDWPVLSSALPLGSHMWNVPAALGGAASCLFVRELAELRRYFPRAHTAFGWLAWVFVAVAASNVLKHFGAAAVVSAVGNIVFLGSAVFTVVVVFLAWRRGTRAAGWFLLAWGLLEVFTAASAARLLFTDTDHLLYFGLPLSMVAAAVLIALGVAERLQDQRLALTEAERRAQTDPLTGVLNRRSLIERLDAACLRARARGLPIALLFIDLDHFKEINDSYGHPAGDACLAAIIGPIQSELRQSDVIGRYGGEEFVVILSSADTAAAFPIAERILERVADVCVEGFGQPIQLTCSIGVAASDTLGVWGEKLIAHADAAVYAAKRSGRNRVQIAVPRAA